MSKVKKSVFLYEFKELPEFRQSDIVWKEIKERQKNPLHIWPKELLEVWYMLMRAFTFRFSLPENLTEMTFIESHKEFIKYMPENRAEDEGKIEEVVLRKLNCKSREELYNVFESLPFGYMRSTLSLILDFTDQSSVNSTLSDFIHKVFVSLNGILIVNNFYYTDFNFVKEELSTAVDKFYFKDGTLCPDEVYALLNNYFESDDLFILERKDGHLINLVGTSTATLVVVDTDNDLSQNYIEGKIPGISTYKKICHDFRIMDVEPDKVISTESAEDYHEYLLEMETVMEENDFSKNNIIKK